MTRTQPRPAERPAAREHDDAVLSVSGLECRYGDFTAVRGIDLTVRPGELYGLLGTNGAGKTTSIDTMLGQRRAQAGQVRLLGVDPYRHRRRLAGRVSGIAQQSGFADDLTVAETVTLWRRLHPDREGPADPLADVDMSHRRDVRVRQLSGGERRRLDLALAITTAPEMLFLDEPTTGLDPASRQRTWEVLRGLRDNGCAIVLTTHYLEEAEALSDNLAIMDSGRIVVSGTVAQVVSTRPAEISCRLAADAELVDVPELYGTLGLDGGTLRLRTARLQDDLYRLLDWAHRRDIALRHLRATEASLHEVFTEIQRDSSAAHDFPQRTKESRCSK